MPPYRLWSSSLNRLCNRNISPSPIFSYFLINRSHESFSVKIHCEFRCIALTKCSVCLLEYQPEDRLQPIPACGHTFHMSCIDLWLASHSTCPLCLSLLTSVKSSTKTSNITVDRPQSTEEPQATEFSESRSNRNLDTTVIQNVPGEDAIGAHCIDVEGENAGNNQQKHEDMGIFLVDDHFYYHIIDIQI